MKVETGESPSARQAGADETVKENEVFNGQTKSDC